MKRDFYIIKSTGYQKDMAENISRKGDTKVLKKVGKRRKISGMPLKETRQRWAQADQAKKEFDEFVELIIKQGQGFG